MQTTTEHDIYFMFKASTFMDVYSSIHFSGCLIQSAILSFYCFCQLLWFVECLWMHKGCFWIRKKLKVCSLSSISSDFKRSSVCSVPEVALHCIKSPWSKRKEQEL